MKTYEDCKNEVARRNSYGKLVMGHLVKHFDEAAELYAQQQSIAFYLWMKEETSSDDEGMHWYYDEKTDMTEKFTTAALYELFKNQQEK